mmetsp:Transcript_30467/g.99490  ORF Transcript_30467/g.99490 Transcript_30467/m.99490 type:complete len:223 (+) Transcript_30467:546-1214(+)
MRTVLPHVGHDVVRSLTASWGMRRSMPRWKKGSTTGVCSASAMRRPTPHLSGPSLVPGGAPATRRPVDDANSPSASRYGLPTSCQMRASGNRCTHSPWFSLVSIGANAGWKMPRPRLMGNTLPAPNMAAVVGVPKQYSSAHRPHRISFGLTVMRMGSVAANTAGSSSTDWWLHTVSNGTPFSRAVIALRNLSAPSTSTRFCTPTTNLEIPTTRSCMDARPSR